MKSGAVIRCEIAALVYLRIPLYWFLGREKVRRKCTGYVVGHNSGKRWCSTYELRFIAVRPIK